MRALNYVVFLAFAACGHSHAADAHAPSAPQAPPSASAACPAQEFLEFLEAFSENSEVQMTFTRSPLEMQQLDLNARPEPKPFIRRMEHREIKFPVFPNNEERKARLLTLRVDQLASRQAKITLVKSDTDYQISYFFGRGACWELERIEDWSL